MRINYEKSTIYRIGSLKDTNAKFYSHKKLLWTNEPVCILGLYVSHDKKQMLTQNLDPVIEKAEAILKMWYNRGLSLLGKILTVNTLVSSLFTYKFAVMANIPEKYFQRIESMITQYIWDERKPKLSLKILQGLKRDGGLGLIDMRTKAMALKAQWIERVLKDDAWKSIANLFLKRKMIPEFWETHIAPNHLDKYMWTSFWKEAKEAWFLY